MAYLKIDFFSEVLNKSMQMAVILPERDSPDARLFGYKSIGVKDKDKIPVLYLLHGMTDNYSTWLRNTAIERYASERGMAIVLPDCYLGWYTDMEVGYKYFTFLSEELPNIIAKLLPCISEKREDTFIAGNSMGAYGAVKIALKCPDRYMAAGGFSGGYDVTDHILSVGLGYPDHYWSDIFGKPENVGKEDISTIAEEMSHKKGPKPHLYIWCGLEDWLLYQNHKVKDQLNSAGYDFTYCESKGSHSWADWDHQIEKFMDWTKSIREED